MNQVLLLHSTLLKQKESTTSGHTYDSLQLVRLHRNVRKSAFLLNKSTVLLNRARHGSDTNLRALADATKTVSAQIFVVVFKYIS